MHVPQKVHTTRQISSAKLSACSIWIYLEDWITLAHSGLASVDAWQRRALEYERDNRMNFEVATQLNEQLIRLVEHANQALFIANNSGDEELRIKLQLVLASAIAELDLQVWESIYQQHPSLRPAEMIPVGRGGTR